jgi:shikimate kinase
MTDAHRPCPGTAADRERAAAALNEPAQHNQPLVQHISTPAPDPRQQSAAGPALVLVGPPGAGKSSVGHAVARMTGLSFRDTDSDIEAVAGKPIPDIFLEDGEPHFRTLERAAVAAALAEHTGVLALGGGAVMAPATRALLAGRPVVFLNLSMSTGVRRTGLGANRPLLAGVNPRATYKALLDARLGLYRDVARHEVQTDQLSVADVARTIIEKLELQ